MDTAGLIGAISATIDLIRGLQPTPERTESTAVDPAEASSDPMLVMARTIHDLAKETAGVAERLNERLSIVEDRVEAVEQQLARRRRRRPRLVWD